MPQFLTHLSSYIQPSLVWLQTNYEAGMITAAGLFLWAFWPRRG
jgi:hypothetical protein